MSSVWIISGVAARVEHLMPELADSKLLLEMEGLINSLKSADDETKRSKQFLRLEKLSVQLSYDVADAVERRIVPPKPKFRNPFRRNGGAPDLEGLTGDLKRFKNLIEYVVSEHTRVMSPRGRNGAVSHSRGNDRIPNVPAVEEKVREAFWGSAWSVVCVYGGRGMGKTTLAKKVFDDARGRTEAASKRGFAWVAVSPECEPRTVFEDILHQLNPDVDVKGMGEIAMSEEILTVQKKKTCLIVLDDICSLHDWKIISVALLSGASSKTLVTTSSPQLAKILKSKSDFYQLPPLIGPQISAVLMEKASFDDQELEAYGEIISDLSRGSPLYAVIMGKSIKAADENARRKLVHEYCNKRRNQAHPDRQGGGGGGENEALDACYGILPDEVKACLNYMGLFPEGQVIEVDKLHLLWEAEGLMMPPPKNEIFLHSLRSILEKLASRNLVKVEEDIASMTRMYKSCQLHHLIRNFCIIKGVDEEFFEIIDFERTKKIAASTRRVAVYLSNYKEGDAITSFAAPNKIRSLLVFDTPRKSTRWPSEISDLKVMKGLRVMDMKGVDFRVAAGNKVLKGIGKLAFLRYLSFRGCWLKALPPSITKLLLLETLDLRVDDSCNMIIPDVALTEMKRLRNLYFPLHYMTEGGAKLRLFHLESLEILVNFRAGVCDVKDLYLLSKLQILAAIVEAGHADFEAIVEYSCRLETTLQQSSFMIKNFIYSAGRVAVLKRLLNCKSLHSLHIEGNIKQLPEDVAVSPNLSEITLDGSELEDDPNDVLQRLRNHQGLKNLRSLVLANDAFAGDKISVVFSRNYFPNLRSLNIKKLHNLEKLVFHKRSTPKLSTLVVDECQNLKQVLMPKAMETRLQAAHRKKGDDVYLLQLTPTTI